MLNFSKMKLVQSTALDPSWPEDAFKADGTPIKLAAAAKLKPAERAGVYFMLPNGKGKAWPWKEAGYYVDDDGEPLAAVGMPMRRDELAALGLTDKELGIDPRAPDTGALQRERRQAYEKLMHDTYSRD